MDIPLVDGRLLTDEDIDVAAEVAVINETLAQAFWPDVSPIGDWIEWNQGDIRRVQVVGVVGDARITAVDTPPTPQFYIPYTEQPGGGQIFVARYTGSSADVIPLLHKTAEQIGTGRLVDRITPLQTIVDQSTADARFAALLMTALGLVALLLSAVGVYGAISYIVTLRSKEVGIRIALGAQSSDVLGLNVREGLTLTLGGVIVGLVGAAVATRFLEVLLFGVAATDPATFGTVALAVVLVGGVAALVPSIRATRVDPLVALQSEA
jgi:putative ABC transport system permease protein